MEEQKKTGKEGKNLHKKMNPVQIKPFFHVKILNILTLKSARKANTNRMWRVDDAKYLHLKIVFFLEFN